MTSSPRANANPVVAASYTPDELNFHKLFPQVPLNEKLVENYQCGLSRKKIVRMGRLYLTSLRLCFHSTFLSESLMVEWDAVDNVEKKENFVFEAVVVKTAAGDSHYFSAFMYGVTDQAHKMITMLWSVRRRYANTVNLAAVAAVPPSRVVHPRTASSQSTGSTGFPAMGGGVADLAVEDVRRVEDEPGGIGQLLAQQPTGSFAAATGVRSDATAPVSAVSPVGNGKSSGAKFNDPNGDNDHSSSPDGSGENAGSATAVPKAVGAERSVTASPGLGPEKPPADDRRTQTPDNFSMTLSPCAERGMRGTAPVTTTADEPQETTSTDTPITDPSGGTTAALGSHIRAPPPRSPISPSRDASANPPANTGLLSAVAATAEGKLGQAQQRTSGAASPAPEAVGSVTGKETVLSSPLHPPAPIAAPVTAPSTAHPTPATASAAAALTASHTSGTVSSSAVAPAKVDRRAEKAIMRQSVVSDTPHDIFKHFPQVPKTETVVDSFQCSYVVGVHRLGKLYITANFVLFSSVMLSEGVCIKFSEITSIEKEQTMVILDGVTITTRQGTIHNFTSFVNRDSAFNILNHFFAAHRSKQTTRDRLKEAEQQQVQQVQPPQQAAAAAASSSSSVSAPETTAISNSAGLGVPLTAADEGPLKNSSTRMASVDSDTRKKRSKKSSSKKAADTMDSSEGKTVKNSSISSREQQQQPYDDSPENNFKTNLVRPLYQSLPHVTSLEAFSSVKTDYGTGLSDASNFFVKQIVPDIRFPDNFTVFDVFKQAFDDETSLLDEYHEQRQDTRRTWEPWRPALEGSPSMSGQRKLLCTTIIRAVMAKACPFTEFQRFAFFSVNGSPTLMVQFSGQAVGVMFSDSFRAETLMIFSQPNAQTPHVTMRTFGYIQFLRSVWVRGKILSTALDVEMPECYRTLSSMIIKRLHASTPMVPQRELVSEGEAEEEEEESAEEEPSATRPVSEEPLPRRASSHRRYEPSHPSGAAIPVPVAAASPAALGPPSSPPAPPLSGPASYVVLGLYILCAWYSLRGIWVALWQDAAPALPPLVANGVDPTLAAVSSDGGAVNASTYYALVELLRYPVAAALLGGLAHVVQSISNFLQ